MKFILYTLAIIILGYLGHTFLPWWSIVIVAALVGLFTDYSGIRAFSLGFLGVALLWGVYATFVNFQNEGIIASRLGELFGGMSPTIMLLITTLLGGFLGGLGTLTGNQGRKLFSGAKK